nr:MAG: hypothetical protein [Iflaviridae sp.]
MGGGIEEKPDAVEHLVQAIKLAQKDFTTSRPYTIAFCNWINSFDSYFLRKEENKVAGSKPFQLKYGFKVSFLAANGQRILIEMVEQYNGSEKKVIEEQIFRAYCKRILRPYIKYSSGFTQMEASHATDGAIQGSVNVDRESNVILKVDEQDETIENIDTSSSEINKQLASTEKPFDLIGDGYSLMNRWYPLQQVAITEGSTDLFSLKIPEALYTDTSSVNLLPLKGFIYGDLDIEFKLVINAAPFHAGRVIMGLFYCSQGYNETYHVAIGIKAETSNVATWEKFNYTYTIEEKATEINTLYGMVQRPHVILDLAESTTASILAKYNYNKPYVRLLDFQSNKDVNPGIIGGNFVNLRATMLAPLRTGDDQPKSVNCSLFYRFVKAKLTGMTRQHDLTQMDVISTISSAVGLGNEIIGAGIKVINEVERQLTRKGKRISNRDKPSMQFATIPIIPRPRNHFPNGVGLSDAVIMGTDVKSLTTHYEDSGYGPKSYNELAKMPGVLKVVQWSQSQDKGAEIFTEKVQPYDQFIQAQYAQDGGSNLTQSSPLPLHVASNGFMYWSGTIVYEFDFVKTAFHKGLVMISVNFGKKSGSIGSNYEKIVDIQETSRVKITVPYIYDTVARRTNSCSAFGAWPQPAQWSSEGLPPYNQTSISVVVMNPLINIDNVANKIDVVIWKYGGADFCLNSPCQVNNIVTYYDDLAFNIFSLEGFPILTQDKFDSAIQYESNLPSLDVPEPPPPTPTDPETPAAARARPQNRKGFTQMEDEDFSTGIQDDTRFHTGDDTNFKNLLRVPVRIFNGEELKKNQALFVPVIPLTVELIKWYAKHPRLSMTHQSQILRMFRMWRGTLRYTVLVHTQDPVFVTYLPADGTWKRVKASKFLNERIPGGSGQTFDPFAKPRIVRPFYSDLIDLSSSGNFTTMILPQVNPSEQVEIPWNLPVNWAFMNQGDVFQQKAYRDISFTPNGHIVIYSDTPSTISVFLSVGDDFEMGAFCGLTDNIIVSKGNRMDDCRLKTQMDFQAKEVTSDGQLSDYFTAEEEESNVVTKIVKCVKKNKVRFAKPLIYAGATLLPVPVNMMVQGMVVAHTIMEAESKMSNVEQSIGKISNSATYWSDIRKNKILGNIESVTHLVNYELQNPQSKTNKNVRQIENNLNTGKEILEKIDTISKALENPAQKINSILTELGEGITTSKTILNHVEETTLQQADEVLVGCAKVTNGVSDLVGRVQSASASDFVGWLTSQFSDIGLSASEMLENLFTYLYESIVKADYKTVALYIKDTLVNMGLCTYSFITQRIGLFSQLITNILKKLNPLGTTQMLNIQNELDIECFNTNDYQSLIGLLLGGVLSVFGSTATKNWQHTFKEDQYVWINELMSLKTVAGINTSILFVKNMYSTIFKMVIKILGLKDSELEIREALSSKAGIVTEFCKNAQEFLNEYNNEIISDPVMKSKFWVTICNAYQIQACLCKIKGDSATNVLKSLCQEVIKKSNETMSLFKASCVRYEPFVVCLEGDSGIGKSFLTTRLSVDILKNLNLTMPNIDFRYNVSAGVDYWNLYNGQPIIIYDDWCNLVDTESIRKEISELYQLKTSNVMNAPKAELSEKKTVVNPFAVLLATNNPFPKTNTLIDHKPLYRRRDVLVKVQLKPGGDRNDPKYYENFNHLEFGIYDSSAHDQRNFKFISFTEFQKEIKKRHLLYHEHEARNVKARLQILSEVLSEQALVHHNISDPFTLQARSLYEAERIADQKGKINSLPSDMLNFEVLQLIDMIEEKFKLVHTKDSTFIIQDRTQAEHFKSAPKTQSEEGFLNSYFITPAIRTWNTLYSYLCKWFRMGYFCGNCQGSSLASGTCFKCSQCDEIVCGWCARFSQQKCSKCDHDLSIYIPACLDLIIGYIVYAITQAALPDDWRLSLAGKIIAMITELNIGVPLLVLQFFKTLLTSKKASTFENGPIKVQNMSRTQMGEEEEVVEVPGLPSNYRIVDVPRDGDCLAHAIFTGMQQFGSQRHLKFPMFKKFLKGIKRTKGVKLNPNWFDTDIHGVATVNKYGIPIHLIEKTKVEDKEVWVHSLITQQGVKQVEYQYGADANQTIHIVSLGDSHFRAILVDKVEEVREKEIPLNEQFIESVLKVEEGPIKMEPLPDKPDCKLVIPSDWWFESLIQNPGLELYCNHGKIKKIEGSKIEMDDDHFTIAGERFSLTKCNATCSLTKEFLKEIVVAYYDANKLRMEEELKLMQTGCNPWSDCTIPKPYRSEWLESQLKKIQSDVVEDKGWLKNLISKIFSYTKIGAVVAIIYFSLKYAYKFLGGVCSKLMKLFFSPVTQSPSERRHTSAFQHSQRLRKMARKRSGRTQLNIPDTEHYTNIKNKICQNYVLFKTDKVKKMVGLGLYGSKVLIPKHYIAPLQKAERIDMQFYQAKHETIQLNPANLKIKYFGDKDCAIVEVSKAIYFVDIRKFFMPRGEYENFMAHKSEIIVPKDNNIYEHDVTIHAILDDYEAYDEFSEMVFKTSGALEYNFEQRGACGSIILCKNRNHPIVGIHVAGHEGYQRGIGARICQEELGEEASFDIPSLPYTLTEEGILDFGEDVNVEYLGKVVPEMTPFLPTKTNIEHSLINDHFETPNKLQPAILSAKDPRYTHQEASPLIFGVKKHGKPCLDFDSEFVKKASDILCERLLSFKWDFKHKVQIYDLKTAALGLLECIDYYDWLPDSTSAGWPYNVLRNEKGPLKTQKKCWMQYIRDETMRPVDVIIDPQVLADIERDMSFRREGLLAPIVFQDVLKDEKRPLEKLLKQGGTRVFSMSPINASLALRQYTLDLTSYLRKHRIKNWCAIGINPDGPEWGKLVTVLKLKGNNIFTIDYSNFGPGLNIEVASEFRTLLKQFYNKHQALAKGDENVVDSLIYELMYSVHLAGGTLYRTKSGSPSGAAITVEINSFTHLMYVLICWQIIGRVLFLMGSVPCNAADKSFLKLYNPLVKYFKEIKLESEVFDDMDGNFEILFENLAGCVYGDDGIFSITDEFREVFNARTISIVLACHGICATDASKQAKVQAYTTLQEATFLKRKFSPHPLHRGEWLAPIDKTSVEECARWIQKGQGSDIATVENAKASLLLAYGHGPRYYQNWRKLLNEYLAREELPTTVLSWENIDQMFYTSYYKNKFLDSDFKEISEKIRYLCSS